MKNFPTLILPFYSFTFSGAFPFSRLKYGDPVLESSNLDITLFAYSWFSRRNAHLSNTPAVTFTFDASTRNGGNNELFLFFTLPNMLKQNLLKFKLSWKICKEFCNTDVPTVSPSYFWNFRRKIFYKKKNVYRVNIGIKLNHFSATIVAEITPKEQWEIPW